MAINASSSFSPYTTTTSLDLPTPELTALPVEVVTEILDRLPQLTDKLTLAEKIGNRLLQELTTKHLSATKQLSIWITTNPFVPTPENDSQQKQAKTSSENDRPNNDPNFRLRKILAFWSSAVKRVMQQSQQQNLLTAELSPLERNLFDETYNFPNFNPYVFGQPLASTQKDGQTVKKWEQNNVAWLEKEKRALGSLFSYRLPELVPSLNQLNFLAVDPKTGVFTAGALLRHYFEGLKSSPKIGVFFSEISPIKATSVHLAAFTIENIKYLTEFFLSLFNVFAVDGPIAASSSAKLRTLSIFIRLPMGTDWDYGIGNILGYFFNLKPSPRTTTLADVEELLLGGFGRYDLCFLLSSHIFPSLKKLVLILAFDSQTTPEALTDYFCHMSTDRRQKLTHLSVYTYDSLKEYHERELKKEKDGMKSQADEEVAQLDANLVAYIKKKFPRVVSFNGQLI